MSGTTRRYRTNLPPPEDVTLTGRPPIVTPGFLRHVGELLFGERWQSPLAQDLGRFRGKPLNPAVLHNWTTSTRSVPDWVSAGLVAALETRRSDWQRRAEAAHDLAERLKSSHAAQARPVGSREPERLVPEARQAAG